MGSSAPEPGRWRTPPLRGGRDKAAFYREAHVRQHAGLRWDATPPPPVPRVPFETALLRLGEETGQLDTCLRLLAEYFQAEDRMTLAVLRKAAYPVMTGVAATFIAPAPLLVLGHPATYLITVGTGLLGWMAGGRVALAALAGWYLRQPRFVLGRLLRALTIAIEAGLPLGRAVPLAAQASGSREVQAHVAAQGTRILGQPLAATFRGCPLVPFTAIAAMEVADASGDYSGSLRKLAELIES